MITKFIAGNKIKHALNICKNIETKHYIPIINYVTEHSSNNNVYNEYNNIIKNVKNKNYFIALKPSALNFNKDKLFSIANSCKNNNIKLIIDAENNNNIKEYRNIVNELIYKYNDNSSTIIKTYQMYRKDSLLELKDDITFFDEKNKLLSCKLVRGAYLNTEYKQGHLYNKKKNTDYNYNKGILEINKINKEKHLICTHNKESILLAMDLDKHNNKFIITNLLGMNQQYMDTIKHCKSSYIPYGPYWDMIPYLTRRLYENLDQIKFMTSI